MDAFVLKDTLGEGVTSVHVLAVGSYFSPVLSLFVELVCPANMYANPFAVAEA
jgi:hypothetical protein